MALKELGDYLNENLNLEGKKAIIFMGNTSFKLKVADVIEFIREEKEARKTLDDYLVGYNKEKATSWRIAKTEKDADGTELYFTVKAETSLTKSSGRNSVDSTNEGYITLRGLRDYLTDLNLKIEQSSNIMGNVSFKLKVVDAIKVMREKNKKLQENIVSAIPEDLRDDVPDAVIGLITEFLPKLDDSIPCKLDVSSANAIGRPDGRAHSV